jgi:hypothetical protein
VSVRLEASERSAIEQAIRQIGKIDLAAIVGGHAARGAGGIDLDTLEKLGDLAQAARRLSDELGRQPLVEEIAERMGVQDADVRVMRESVLLVESLSTSGAMGRSSAPPEAPQPVPMLLWCPECGERHVDVGERATKRHHTHACQYCGMSWRPAIVATTGVQFLPGFKNGT